MCNEPAYASFELWRVSQHLERLILILNCWANGLKLETTEKGSLPGAGTTFQKTSKTQSCANVP